MEGKKLGEGVKARRALKQKNQHYIAIEFEQRNLLIVELFHK